MKDTLLTNHSLKTLCYWIAYWIAYGCDVFIECLLELVLNIKSCVSGFMHIGHGFDTSRFDFVQKKVGMSY